MGDHRFEIKSVDMTATKSEETIAELVRVWESSVRATHLFLSESEIDRIKGYVPTSFCPKARSTA